MAKDIKCVVCKGPNKWSGEYGSKMGKNGRMAKWPIYEGCKNPECKVGRRNLGIITPSDDGWGKVVEKKIDSRHRGKGELYQAPLSNKFSLLEAYKRMLELHPKMLAGALWVEIAAKDLEHLPGLKSLSGELGLGDIEVKPTRRITPGYRYMFVMLEAPEK